MDNHVDKSARRVVTHQDRVDAVIQFALATARCVHDDDWMLRDLRPIHLIKYVYLADLAYAEKHGETYTGAPWTFYHFGPWATTVSHQIEPALTLVHAEKKQFESQFRDDCFSWCFPDREDAELLASSLERTLPAVVTFAVRQAVRTYGSATTDLLHHVYLTSPMLGAAPGEALEFRAKDELVEGSGAESPPEQPLTTRQIKKRREIIAGGRELVRTQLEKDKAKRRRRSPRPEPIHDEIHAAGMRWLDSLAGSKLPEKGELYFADDVWKSRFRKDPSIP